jgi:Periplasmic binding protein
MQRRAEGLQGGKRFPWRLLVSGSALLLALAASSETGVAGASAAQLAGSTSTAIKVGIPYPDLAALKSLGITLDQGSFPDAYNALIANLNAHGGINGRKVVPDLVAVNPALSTAASSACTQLTQDDHVLVTLGPVTPLCYQQAGVSTIEGANGASLSPTAAPNFTLITPPSAFDPLQISVFTKLGVFKGKKVGVFSASADKTEVPIVLAALKSNHVNVALSAVDSAPTSDQAASDQQIQVIAQRFKSSGVSVVVGVGTGAVGFLDGLEDIQSSYAPRIVATNFDDFYATATSKSRDDPTYLKGAVTASSVPPGLVLWKDPAIQKCVAIIKKAYPSTVIGSPVGASSTAPTTWVAAENSCQNLAMFSAIAKAAGKTLNTKTFAKAGNGLRNIAVPGMGAPISFAPGRPYASGRVYLFTYDTSSQQFVSPSKSING